MSRINPLWRFMSHNIYWITTIIGVLIVAVLDENSFLTCMKYDMQISDLEEQIDEYNSQYERDDQKLKELRRNPRAITKIARENYMMKADDEDIFVLSDDEKQETSKNETAE